MADRSGRGLAQAHRDLDHAADTSEHEHFEWACFAARQGAEKAGKAIYLHVHGEGWGRSCTGHGIGDRWNPIFG